ncbi:transcription termination factor Rho [Nocardioides currus]
MTETPDAPTAAPATKRAKSGGGLSSMLLADLKSMASGLGVPGAGSMKKAQLVDAIKAVQSGGSKPADKPAEKRADKPAERADKPAEKPAEKPAGNTERAEPAADAPSTPTVQVTTRQRTRNRQPEKQGGQQAEKKQDAQKQAEKPSYKPSDRPAEKQAEQKQVEQKQADQKQADQKQDEKPAERQGGQRQQDRQPNQNQNQQGQQGPHQNEDTDEDGEGGSRRNRRRRGRDRDRQANRAPGGRNEPDTTVLEDDVLVPAAGILDVLDNYAFVRTSGYLPGTDDVYLSLSMVRRFGLRRGDAVVGQVRQPREGERKEKFNPMVRIDSVNGADPEAARERTEFESFTPVHPTERLRLETDGANLIGRVIDIAAPIGKGQRGLVVAPPKTGRTTLLQSVAQSISKNNPEVHLMVVLLDARPEEVTDFQRAVKGEVIASTFDRAASDHTMLAELAIERAKRLVELGHDVTVLLDSVTSLARAYNVSAPATGRTLAGGVDAGAVHPPKQLFGAARNVEGGGSLTVLATVVVETGSATDEVIYEELGGTANMELRLRRELAEGLTYPAVDFVASGTRHEALLSSDQEAGIVASLRRRMSADPIESVAPVLEQIRGAQNNIAFLTHLQPGSGRGK